MRSICQAITTLLQQHASLRCAVTGMSDTEANIMAWDDSDVSYLINVKRITT